jgi:hypothetical protein
MIFPRTRTCPSTKAAGWSARSLLCSWQGKESTDRWGGRARAKRQRLAPPRLTASTCPGVAVSRAAAQRAAVGRAAAGVGLALALALALALGLMWAAAAWVVAGGSAAMAPALALVAAAWAAWGVAAAAACGRGHPVRGDGRWQRQQRWRTCTCAPSRRSGIVVSRPPQQTQASILKTDLKIDLSAYSSRG